jgi:hypothetical protein
MLTCYAPVQSLLFFGASRLLNRGKRARSLKDFRVAAIFGANWLHFCGITGGNARDWFAADCTHRQLCQRSVTSERLLSRSLFVGVNFPSDA